MLSQTRLLEVQNQVPQSGYDMAYAVVQRRSLWSLTTVQDPAHVPSSLALRAWKVPTDPVPTWTQHGALCLCISKGSRLSRKRRRGALLRGAQQASA